MGWFRNLKIRVKLLIGFLVVALIGGLIGVMGFTGISKVHNSLLEISGNRMVATSALDQMLGQVQNVL